MAFVCLCCFGRPMIGAQCGVRNDSRHRKTNAENNVHQRESREAQKYCRIRNSVRCRTANPGTQGAKAPCVPSSRRLPAPRSSSNISASRQPHFHTNQALHAANSRRTLLTRYHHPASPTLQLAHPGDPKAASEAYPPEPRPLLLHLAHPGFREVRGSLHFYIPPILSLEASLHQAFDLVDNGAASVPKPTPTAAKVYGHETVVAGRH
jgi:hypothetical protein